MIYTGKGQQNIAKFKPIELPVIIKNEVTGAFPSRRDSSSLEGSKGAELFFNQTRVNSISDNRLQTPQEERKDTNFNGLKIWDSSISKLDSGEKKFSGELRDSDFDIIDEEHPATEPVL